jgi:hypothetical protein
MSQRSLTDHPAKDAENVPPQAEGPGSPPLVSNDAEATVERWRSGALFVAIGVVIAIDLLEDWRGGSTPSHLGLEAFVLVLAAMGIWRLWVQFRSERKQVRGLRSRLAAASGGRGAGGAGFGGLRSRPRDRPAIRQLGLAPGPNALRQLVKGLAQRLPG